MLEYFSSQPECRQSLTRVICGPVPTIAIMPTRNQKTLPTEQTFNHPKLGAGSVGHFLGMPIHRFT